jgi:hypothetical protein
MTKARTLGNFVSNGNPLSDGSLAASEITGLATVATTGSYTDLTNEPTAPSGTIVGTTDTQTLTNKTFSNDKIVTARETITISATAATGTINYDVVTQSILYYTTNASANFTINVRGDGSTTLNSIMNTGESLSFVFLSTNGATAYYNSAFQVDGSAVTAKWQGGTAPSTGNASSIDAYVYTVIKTGSAAFTVLASQTKFA